MRRLIEEYGIVLLYIITGILCIVMFSAAFFGEQSSVSKVINSSIDSSANRDTSIVYNISFDLEGGSWKEGEIIKDTYTKEDPMFVLPQPKREGYLFAGWTGSRLTSPTQNVVVPTGSTGNRTYTATWTKGYYEIIYDSNLAYMRDAVNVVLYNNTDRVNGYKNLPGINTKLVESWMTGDKDSTLAEYSVNPSIKNSMFVFKGHKFIGWSLNADGSDAILNGTNGERTIKTITAGTTYSGDLSTKETVDWTTEKVTLYAQWEPIYYKISYIHSNQGVQGVENIDNPVKYRIIDNIPLAPAVLRGYTFKGWYFRDPYISYSSDAERMEYRLRYYDFNEENKMYGYSSAKIAGTDNELDAASLTKADLLGYGSTGDITLYSYFERNKYKIIFLDFDGNRIITGTDAGGNQLDYLEKVYSQDITVQVNTPTKKGYDFFGWQVGLTETRIDGKLEENYIKYNSVLNDEMLGYVEKDYQEKALANASYEIVLYPVFGPHQYYIYYSANGGINTPKAQVKTYGIDLKLANYDDVNADGVADSNESRLTRTGYDFVGWSINSMLDGSNLTCVSDISAIQDDAFALNETLICGGELLHGDFSSETSGTVGENGIEEGNVTLFAIWKAKPVTVLFNMNLPEYDPRNHLYGVAEEVKDFVTTMDVPFNTTFANGVWTGGTGLPEIYMAPEDSTEKPLKTYKYRFEGWYTSPECASIYNDSYDGTNEKLTCTNSVVTNDTSVASISDYKNGLSVVLYAKWKPITYVIELRSNWNNN